MELMYPIIAIISILAIIVVIFIKPNKKQEYIDGKKVANTKYIKETEYYKSKIRKYKIISTTLTLLSIACIVISSILSSRIITVKTRSDEKYNRDILIGLDISTSECKVNLEFAKKMRKALKNLEGDRIGIVIFNTSPVVYCPLTDDYDYIDECLKTVEEQSKIVSDNNGMLPFSIDKEGQESREFWSGGVLANNEEKGSSLVGDGLAGTVFSFPDLKENKDRTRILLFATDNAVEGTETVSLDDACGLCKKYGINFYAYCPSVEMNKYTSKEKIQKYKNSVEEYGGGEFYTGDLEKATNEIVEKIKSTKTSYMKTSKKKIITDHPENVFIYIVILFLILIIIEKRIRL